VRENTRCRARVSQFRRIVTSLSRTGLSGRLLVFSRVSSTDTGLVPSPPLPSRVPSCSFFGATCLGALIEPIESNVCVRESNLANTNASGRLRSLFSENTLALSTSRPLFFPYFFVTSHPSFQLNTAVRRKEQFRSRDSETGSRARMSNQPGIAVEINQASPADLAIKMTRLIDLQQAEVITRALRVRVSARSRSARPLAPRRLSQLRFPDQSR